jgi:flavin-binding protein dodecin
MTTTRKNCRGGRVHDDALALVEYLLAQGGRVAKTNDSLAFDLSFVINHGGGVRQVDKSRFAQARNHVKDSVRGGGPCCGYRLHYRSTVRNTEYALIDPNGSLGSHLDAAIETVRGWAVREAQHHTENQRQVETFEVLGDHALSRGDKEGYRICVKAAVELDRDGTVTSNTMADLQVWLSNLMAAVTP